MTPRPTSFGKNPYDSVFWSQDIVATLEAKRRALVEKLKALDTRIEIARDAHRRQIARSLRSPFNHEREAAEGIAEWWGVKPEEPELRILQISFPSNE